MQTSRENALLTAGVFRSEQGFRKYMKTGIHILLRPTFAARDVTTNPVLTFFMSQTVLRKQTLSYVKQG